MDVVVAAMKPTLISLSVTTKALGCPGVLSISTNIWKGVFFCEQEVSTVGPKASLIPNRCYHSGCVVPFTGRRQVEFASFLSAAGCQTVNKP